MWFSLSSSMAEGHLPSLWGHLQMCQVLKWIVIDRTTNIFGKTEPKTELIFGRTEYSKKTNIFFFILLELYWIIRPSIFVLILQNNQTELHSWCLWMCFKNIKCYPQKQLGTLISLFTVHWILHITLYFNELGHKTFRNQTWPGLAIL